MTTAQGILQFNEEASWIMASEGSVTQSKTVNPGGLEYKIPYLNIFSKQFLRTECHSGFCVERADISWIWDLTNHLWMLKTAKINSHEGRKHIDLGVDFKNKEWNISLHLGRIVAWNLIWRCSLRCQEPGLDGLQHEGGKERKAQDYMCYKTHFTWEEKNIDFIRLT